MTHGPLDQETEEELRRLAEEGGSESERRDLTEKINRQLEDEARRDSHERGYDDKKSRS